VLRGVALKHRVEDIDCGAAPVPVQTAAERRAVVHERTVVHVHRAAVIPVAQRIIEDAAAIEAAAANEDGLAAAGADVGDGRVGALLVAPRLENP
jgi:hypothetical protein